MTDEATSGSAELAQREANDMVATEDDEHTEVEDFKRTGEPPRNALANQEGAS